MRPEHACAVFACRLVDTVDVGTHFLFIGEVVDAERLSDEEPLTYSYYHSVLKGKTQRSTVAASASSTVAACASVGAPPQMVLNL